MAEYKVTAGGDWQVCVNVAELVAARLRVGLPELHHPSRAALRVHPDVAALLPSAIDEVPIYGDGRHLDTIEEVTRRGWHRVEPGHWQDGGRQVWVDSIDGAIRVGVDDTDEYEGCSLAVSRDVALDLARQLLDLAGESGA